MPFGAATFASGLPLLQYKWSLLTPTGVEEHARLLLQAASDGSFVIGYAQSKAHIFSNATDSLPVVSAYNASFANALCQIEGTNVEVHFYNTTTGRRDPQQVAQAVSCAAGQLTVHIPAMTTDIAFTAAVHRLSLDHVRGAGARTNRSLPIMTDDEGAPVPRQYFMQQVDHYNNSAGIGTFIVLRDHTSHTARLSI